MGFRSRYDSTGESQKMGESAEGSFELLALKKNLKIEKASEKQQKSHIDFILTDLKNKKYFVDVKACKKTSRNSTKTNENLVWIEFKNVAGFKGWLYGAADFIAFERSDDFVIVPRTALVNLCERIVNTSKKVSLVEDALYSIYNRKGRKDEISLIKMEDILKNTKCSIWQKSN
jgi:hypothetical protein